MLPGMKTMALAETKVARKVVMHWVAANLHRLESNVGYYALPKRGDKQFRRSLHTLDRKPAERRLAELRKRAGGLVSARHPVKTGQTAMIRAAKKGRKFP
jgi:hypothetical protein